MRNYREKTILCGCIKLRKYNKIDLCRGYFKNVERDFIYTIFFIFLIIFLIIIYAVGSENETEYYGNI
jgi:hypothetical protein